MNVKHRRNKRTGNLHKTILNEIIVVHQKFLVQAIAQGIYTSHHHIRRLITNDHVKHSATITNTNSRFLYHLHVNPPQIFIQTQICNKMTLTNRIHHYQNKIVILRNYKQKINNLYIQLNTRDKKAEKN